MSVRRCSVLSRGHKFIRTQDDTSSLWWQSYTTLLLAKHMLRKHYQSSLPVHSWQNVTSQPAKFPAPFLLTCCSEFDLPSLRPWMWCRHHTWNGGEVRLGSLEFLSRVLPHFYANPNCGCVSPSMASYSGVLRLWLFDTVWYCLAVWRAWSCPKRGFTADLQPASTELSMANGNSVSGVSCGRERHFGHPGILQPLWIEDSGICSWKEVLPTRNGVRCLGTCVSRTTRRIIKEISSIYDRSTHLHLLRVQGRLCAMWILWTLRFQIWTWEADSPANALTPSRQVPAIWCLSGIRWQWCQFSTGVSVFKGFKPPFQTLESWDCWGDQMSFPWTCDDFNFIRFPWLGFAQVVRAVPRQSTPLTPSIVARGPGPFGSQARKRRCENSSHSWDFLYMSKMDRLYWKIQLEWMIWRYPYFRKPPYQNHANNLDSSRDQWSIAGAFVPSGPCGPGSK